MKKLLIATVLLVLFSGTHAEPINFEALNLATSAYGIAAYESVPRLMEAFNGKIYFIISGDGTANPSKVYCYDPADGLSNSINHTILAETTGRFMVIHKANDLLYFADNLGNLYSYDGISLTEMLETPFSADNYVSSVEEFMGDVYFGTWSSNIYRYDGVNYELVYSVTEDRSRINDMAAWQKDGYIYASVGHINTCCPPTGYVVRSNSGNPGTWQTVFQGFWDVSLFIPTPDYLYAGVIDTAYGYGSSIRRSSDGLSFPAINQSSGQYKMSWGSLYYNDIAYVFVNQWGGGHGYRVVDDNEVASRVQNQNWALTQAVELDGEVYALASSVPHEYIGHFVPAEVYLLTTAPEPPATVQIELDIKPGSCPNPVNTKSKGVLPVAILGTDTFDVSDIDLASIRLEGVAPVRSSIQDVAVPNTETDECACTEFGPDGYDDLTLKFTTQAIVEALGDLDHGDMWQLYLEGVLKDGTPIEGSDCVIIHGKARSLHGADANKDGVVNTVDFSIFADNWLQSSTD